MFSSEPDPGKLLVTLHIDIDRFILWKTNMAAVHLEKLEIICKSAKDWPSCKIPTVLPTFSSTWNLMHLQSTLLDVAQCLEIQNGGYPPGKAWNYLYLSRGLTYMQNSNGYTYIFEYTEPDALTVDIVRRRQMPGISK